MILKVWEQYSSEIGTKNGPLRYVEDTSQCDHLNDFQPFDIESWWAERSMNEMYQKSPSLTTNESFSTIVLNPKADGFGLFDNDNKKYLVDKALLNKFTASQLNNFNRFQICLS